MVSRLFIVMLMSLTLVGCTQTGGVDAWVKPIFISKDDLLTEGTAKQVLIHNETIESLDK